MSTDPVLVERWLWLTTSLGIALLAIAVRLILERPGVRTASSPKTKHRTILAMPWIIHPLRLLYAVGIPAAAFLWRGALTTSGLGLQQFFWVDTQALDMAPGSWDNWTRDIGWTCVFAFGLWVIVTIADQTIKRMDKTRGTKHRPDVALREAVYHQVHWAFYREPFVLVLGIGLGTWAGLIPVAAEALINPARWTDLQSPTRGRDLLIRASLAVTSALLFIQTQNLWLTILADMALVWLLGQTQEPV